MTKEDIIRMAREAGIDADTDTLCRYEGWVEPLERFAEIVCAADRAEAAIKLEQRVKEAYQDGHIAGVKAEREACAKMCENMTLEWEDQPSIAQAELATMMDCALAIRSRGPA